MLILAWMIIERGDAKKTREIAGAEDPGRRMVYFLVVLTSFVTLFAATWVARHLKSVATEGERSPLVALCLGAVTISWGLTHTSFTLRYAHLYYREDEEGDRRDHRSPATTPPSYFDFAYFAFTIGMCFQVSDTTVTSCLIRRAVLAHAILSFAYTTVILAFVLNLVFGTLG